MKVERFVVLAAARPRREWFASVGAWADAGLLPVTLVKCLSTQELRARLDSTRVSAILLDAGLAGVDRDLLAAATARGAATFVVDDADSRRDWPGLGASGVLPPGFEPDALLRSLQASAVGVPRPHLDHAAAADEAVPEDPTRTGRLVTVCGIGGVGTSTVAMALAQGLSARPADRGAVVLADLDLEADLSLYHDEAPEQRGLHELVDAHRSTTPDRVTVETHLRLVPSRGYHLLLGVRRRRAWTALGPSSIDAAVTGLLLHHRWVVADVAHELDGEAITGSADLEDRNALSRIATTRADVVVAVGDPTLRGIRGLTRLLGELGDHGARPTQVLRVVNRAPAARPARGRVVDAVDRATRPAMRGGPVVTLPSLRRLEDVHMTVDRFPPRLVDPLVAAVDAMTSPRVATAGPPPHGGAP